MKHPTYTIDRFGGLEITYPDGLTAYLQPGATETALAIDWLENCETDADTRLVLDTYRPDPVPPVPPVRTGPGGDFTRDHWPRPGLRIPRALAVVIGLALGAGVVVAIEYLNGRL